MFFFWRKSAIFNKYISEIGIESTIIRLDTDITILQYGLITQIDIETEINNHSISDIPSPKIIKDSVNNTLFTPSITLSHEFISNKPIYIVNFIDLQFDSKKYSMLEELKNKTRLYLDTTLLIDFKSLCIRHKDKFIGYVDLSINGSFKEAMYNLYNIFHQIDNIYCTRVFIFNFSYIDDKHNIPLWERLNKIVHPNIIYIPEALLSN